MAEASDQALEKVGIEWTMAVDAKSEKKSNMAMENMISLIADLSIIGKVAMDVLGKMWDGVQSSIQANLSEMGDIDFALQVGVDPDDLMALKYAVSQIGGTNKDAMSMLGETDKLIQAFRNPATDPEKIGEFYETLGKQGVSKEDIAAIKSAIDDQDVIKTIKMLGETRDELGDEFSNFIAKFNLGSLGSLENDFQYADWLEAWDKASSRLAKVNTEGLDDLQDGWADIKQAMKNLTLYFGGESGGAFAVFGETLLSASKTITEWADMFKGTEAFSAHLENFKTQWKADMDLLSGKINILDWFKVKGESHQTIADAKIQDEYNKMVKNNPELEGLEGKEALMKQLLIKSQPTPDVTINVERVVSSNAEEFIESLKNANSEIADELFSSGSRNFK